MSLTRPPVAAYSSASPTSRLVPLAEQVWGELSLGEELLLAAAEQGTVGRFQGDPDQGASVETADAWEDTRRVRAELLRWLFVDGQAAATVDRRGVQFCAARVEGSLDLSMLELPYPLRLLNCVFTEEFRLDSASVQTLSLRGLFARGARPYVRRYRPRGRATGKDVKAR